MGVIIRFECLRVEMLKNAQQSNRGRCLSQGKVPAHDFGVVSNTWCTFLNFAVHFIELNDHLLYDPSEVSDP